MDKLFIKRFPKPRLLAGILALFLALTFLVTSCSSSTNLELTTNTVGVCSAAQIDRWNTVVNDQEGVDARDPVGHQIGSYPAERSLLLGRNWYPADTEKRILCGTLHHFNYYDPSGDEADWNNFIIPNPPYTNLITDLEPLRGSGWHSCDGQFDCMEAEITPDEHFYGNPWFPKVHGNASDESPLEGQTICTYGPWVWEEVHGNRPEIHPSELYWWRWGNDAVRLMLLHDDSNRFYDPDDFADLPDPTPAWWRPWSEAPRSGEFRIPFEINLDPLESIPTFIITEPGQWIRNVVTGDFAAARRDSDYGTEHAIEYNGDIVLRADEAQLDDDRIGVQFVDICRDSANTRLQGYVQLTSVVGVDDTGGEGYHVIDVLRYELDAPEDDPPFIQPTAPEVTVLTGKTDRQTLRRQESDPKPELVADLEVSLLSGTGERQLDDVVVLKVERVDGDERQELEFQADTENDGREGLLGVVKAVPSLSGSKLEVTTETGAVLRLNVPEVVLSPLIFEEALLSVDSDAGAWQTILRILEVPEAVGTPPPTQVVNVHQWQLAAVPYYAPVRDGLVSAEDDSPTAEELIEAWESGDQPRIEELFSSSQPFTVDWSFEATNLRGEVVPVVTDGRASATDIEVKLLKGEIPNAAIQITFPESLEDTIYQVVATATFRDTLGNEGKAQHRVWSHVLANEDSDTLVEELLTTAALVAGISADDLIARSDLEGADLSFRQARSLRLLTMSAATDKRITAPELRSLIQAARLLQEE
jgi:hypothetical protein